MVIKNIRFQNHFIPIFKQYLIGFLAALVLSACTMWGQATLLDSPSQSASNTNSQDSANEKGIPGVPHLLKNINLVPATVSSIVLPNGSTVFTGTDDSHGTELWVTDGTINGTFMLKDINPGSGSSAISFGVINNTLGLLFFRATTPNEGSELWVTDGTIAGTQFVKDTYPGTSNSTISFKRSSDSLGLVFFTAYDPTNGTELWRSDGTSAGTYVVKDVTATGSSTFGSFTEYNGSVYCFINNAPYVTDGTTAGTVILNTSEAWDYTGSFYPWNGHLYFSGMTNGYISSIWKTDGTPGTTTKEIQLTSASDSASNFKDWNGKLYFNIDDYAGAGSAGYEPWLTDGTQGGTSMLKDLLSGNDSYPSFLFDFNGKLLIRDEWEALYTTDGTTAGTSSLYSIANAIGILTNKIIFVGNGGSGTDYEPWVTDGTGGGTFRLKDIYPGTTASNPNSATVIGSTVIFTATDPTNGTELWATDGTSVGTILLADINPGTANSSPSTFVKVGTSAVFTATSDLGNEVWITDGTPGGTRMLADLSPGSAGSFANNIKAIDANRFFFTAYNSSTGSANAYIGNINGTYTLLSNTSVETIGINNHYIYGLGNKVIFDAIDSKTGNQLWVSDGTSSGTQKLIELYPNLTCSNITIYGSNGTSVFFTGSSTDGVAKLYRTDGTVEGTFNLTGPTNSYSLNNFFNFANGNVFFGTNTSATGNEILHTNGTVAGTTPLDLTSGTSSTWSTSTMGFHSDQQLAYFSSGTSGVTGWQLWKSDGSAATSITNFGGAVKYITNYTVFNQLMAFMVLDSSSTYKLYVTDGTAAGTVALLPAGTTIKSSSFRQVVGSKLFFIGNNATYGDELWVTDGTAAGTSMVKDLTAGSTSTSFTAYTYKFGDKMIFSTSSAIWITDGTSAGTFTIKSGTYTNSGIELNGNFVFRPASDPTYGSDLWVTDGTLVGTTLLNDSNPGTASGNPYFLYQDGNIEYFYATDPTNGTELWVTDGTVAGTHLFMDINPGANSSVPSSFVKFGGLLYFIANDGVHGSELWRTDGTVAGTRMVYDINTGPNGSSITRMTVVNNKMYMYATTGSSDSEIWVMDPEVVSSP